MYSAYLRNIRPIVDRVQMGKLMRLTRYDGRIVLWHVIISLIAFYLSLLILHQLRQLNRPGRTQVSVQKLHVCWMKWKETVHHSVWMSVWNKRIESHTVYSSHNKMFLISFSISLEYFWFLFCFSPAAHRIEYPSIAQ